LALTQVSAMQTDHELAGLKLETCGALCGGEFASQEPRHVPAKTKARRRWDILSALQKRAVPALGL
jgi:hypothetical protein